MESNSLFSIKIVLHHIIWRQIFTTKNTEKWSDQNRYKARIFLFVY